MPTHAGHRRGVRLKRAKRGARTLEDVLHSQGFGSRRDCRALVFGGRVQIGGKVLDDPHEDVTEQFEARVGDASFTVDGRHWPYRERAVVMLHKPSGYECSLKPRHHPSVMSLLPSPLRLRGLQPVGRLDEDTTGLLLLTDDGELNHRLTSPKWHVDKVYRITCRHPWADEAAARLLAGVVLDDDPEPAQALAVEPAVEGAPNTVLMTIGEGRYHQVKRMVAAVGNRVDALHRTRMGTLELDATLPAGQWKWLTPEEEGALRTAVKLGPEHGPA